MDKAKQDPSPGTGQWACAGAEEEDMAIIDSFESSAGFRADPVQDYLIDKMVLQGIP